VIARLIERSATRAAAVTESVLAAAGVAPPAGLLILGHMRSGSTLLLHVLMTNPEVTSLGERGTPYRSEADLARLAIAARLSHGAPLRRLRYVADQINHNHLTPQEGLLASGRLRVLFLLRKPEATIASIIELYRVYHPQPWSVAQAVDYYVERLDGLVRLGAALPRAALVSYESLTERPADTLERLRQFLQLPRGFSTTYPTRPFTGNRGDPGRKIDAGAILTPSATVSPAVDAAQLLAAGEAYRRCRAALSRFALADDDVLARHDW